jgi:uncharacterized protein (TIGR02646 family)
LGEEEATYLTKKTREIAAAADPRDTAKTAWKNKNRDRFANIRSVLERSAPGREYCMYCLDSQGTAIDHFLPWSEDPLVTFEWSNYVLACSHCNSNEKRGDFPRDSDGNPLLLNPFDDDPQVHLSLDPVLGERTARTRRGMETIDVFNLNREHLVQGRIDAWVTLEGLLVKYEGLCSRGEESAANEVLATIHRQTFLEVLAEMKRYAASTLGLLNEEIMLIFRAYPKI